MVWVLHVLSLLQNRSEIMAFKYSKWKPNTNPVPKSELPKDKCAPVPKAQRLVRIQDRNILENGEPLITRRRDEILSRIKKEDDRLIKEERRKRNLDIDSRPKHVCATLGNIAFPTTIQRDEQEDHIVNITVEYDMWFAGMPLAGWDSLAKIFVVDEGQQRLLALKTRIQLGQHPDCEPEDWENYPIDLQVIDLPVKIDDTGKKFTDYSPLRIRFIIENGKKLPVSEFDMFVNACHGKLTDSPNAETLPEYEKAADRYYRLRKRNLTPVDPKNVVQMNCAGAFGAVRYLRNNKLKNQDVDNIVAFIADHIPHEPVADMQVLPVKWLFNENSSYHWYDENVTSKVKEWKTFQRYLNATVVKKEGDWDSWESFARDIWARRMRAMKSNTGIPSEYSMLLVIQLTEKSGYKYTGIDPVWYTTHTEVVSGWDVLTATEKAVFL